MGALAEHGATAGKPLMSVDCETHNLEAYDLYLRGRYLAARRTPDGYAQAIRCLEEALTLDPTYALAHCALGACCCGSGFIGYIAPWDAFPRAKAAAAKTSTALTAGMVGMRTS